MISEFPLFVFTLLGGMAAGSAVFLAFLPPKESGKPWASSAAILVLLAVSGVALLLHLGRPERVLFAFSNPTSGITLEGWATLVFGTLVAVDFALSLLRKRAIRLVRVLAAAAGVLLLCAMGYAYASVLAVPAWGTWLSYPFFVFGGLALGSLLAAFFVEGGLANGTVSLWACTSLVLAFASLIGEGAGFCALTLSALPFVVGCVLLAASTGVSLYGRKGASWALPCAFVLAFAGVAVARYAFYAVV